LEVGKRRGDVALAVDHYRDLCDPLCLLDLSRERRSCSWPYDPEELQFLEIINESQSNGLPTLILSDVLTEASERHSEDMGRYGFFAHETIASSYFPVDSKPWERMALSGYDAFMAENLIAGYKTAEEAFEGWRTSPGHEANMLNSNQCVIGIACIYVPSSYYRWYWTTDFGSEVDPTSHTPGEAPPSERKVLAERPAPGRAVEARDADQEGVENGSMRGNGVWKQKTRNEGKNITG